MKARNLIILLAIGLLLLGTVSAQAQRGIGHFRGDRAKPGPGMQGDFQGMSEVLDLTPDQIRQMQDARAEIRRKIIPLQADLRLATLELRELMRNNASKSALDTRIDEIGAMKANIQKIRIGHRLELKSILTDEQRKKFESMPMRGLGFDKGQRGCRSGGFGMGPRGGDYPWLDGDDI